LQEFAKPVLPLLVVVRMEVHVKHVPIICTKPPQTTYSIVQHVLIAQLVVEAIRRVVL
jgi:hypothetical protein